MKRRLFVCFLALTMLLSLTACGAASKTAASSANSRPADTVSATEEKGYFDAETNGGYDDEGRDSGGSVLENQKIIYTGDINLETTAFDETVKALAALAEVKGGYLESSTVGGGSRGYRWADYTVRVPSAQFQGFLDQAGELAHVTWRNTNLENIRDTIIDQVKNSDHDFFLINIDGADEAGHDGQAVEKRDFIEKVDRVVMSELKKLEDVYIFLTADHSTPISVLNHSGDPVPVIITGPEVRVDDVCEYSEVAVAKGGLCRIRGADVMNIMMDLMNYSHKFGA